MNQKSRKPEHRIALSSIFTDVHFWVPLVVLIAGLVLLAWVS
jgi:hypothetical protein